MAFAAGGLLLSWLFLPLPPLVGLTVALIAGLSGVLLNRVDSCRRRSACVGRYFVGPRLKPAPTNRVSR